MIWGTSALLFSHAIALTSANGQSTVDENDLDKWTLMWRQWENALWRCTVAFDELRWAHRRELHSNGVLQRMQQSVKRLCNDDLDEQIATMEKVFPSKEMTGLKESLQEKKSEFTEVERLAQEWNRQYLQKVAELASKQQAELKQEISVARTESASKIESERKLQSTVQQCNVDLAERTATEEQLIGKLELRNEELAELKQHLQNMTCEHNALKAKFELLSQENVQVQKVAALASKQQAELKQEVRGWQFWVMVLICLLCFVCLRGGHGPPSGAPSGSSDGPDAAPRDGSYSVAEGRSADPPHLHFGKDDGTIYIYVVCPGADYSDVEIFPTLNGLDIKVKTPSTISVGMPTFPEQFHKCRLDSELDGCFELVPSSCRLINGILTLTLKQARPPRPLFFSSSGLLAASSSGTSTPLSTSSFQMVYQLNPDENVAVFNERFEEDSDQATIEGSVATASSVGDKSVVSAPARMLGPRCFLSHTRFVLANGEQMTAAELNNAGGQLLKGPNGTEVETKQVVKYGPRDTDIVRITSPGGDFMVTADHMLKVKTSCHNTEVVEAKSLMEERMNGARIYDGTQHWWLVTSAELETQNGVTVVEVTFTDPEAEVLAWVLPRTRPRRHSRELYLASAVACLGAHPVVDQHSLGSNERECKSEGGVLQKP